MSHCNTIFLQIETFARTRADLAARDDIIYF